MAGDQVPVMAGVLFELSGNTGAGSLEQSEAICVNRGVIEGSTIIVIGVETAHWPAFGVQVYIVGPTVADENIGTQVPVIPSIDVVCNGLINEF